MESLQQESITFTGTYSPEDNKLRLYASERLDKDLYNRVREAGFIWAPKQELFVAPMWTPSRADLVMELAGFIDDEETTAEERAAVRAERFEGYQANRAKDAEQALNEYDSLKDGDNVIAASDNWRSQRKAQKKADRIESLGKRAVDMWETSEYWEYRTKGVLSHAAGRNNTRTLLNRIKKLTAGKRKQEKYVKEAEKVIDMWNTGTLSQAWAMKIANYFDHAAYDGLRDETTTPEQAKEASEARQNRIIAYAERWINHYVNRLTYEQAILKASGYVEPPKEKRPSAPPLMNYKTDGITIPPRGYNRDDKDKIWPQIEMTKAEYRKIYKDWKGTRLINGDHRVRIAIIYDPADTTGSGFGRKLLDVCVFLTDSKEHTKP